MLILAVLLAADTAFLAQAQPHAALPFVELSASQPPPRALASHVVRQRSVEVHLDALENRGLINQQLPVSFFPDVSYTAVLSSATRSATGVTWTGRLEGWPSSMAVFAKAGEAVAGFVASAFGTFSLAPDVTGGYAVQQTDWSRLRELGPAVGEVVWRVPAKRLSGSLSSSTYDAATTRSSVDLSPASQSVVDVLVAFTPATLAAQTGGIDELKAKVLVMIGIADAALREAGTGGARLAGMLPVEETADPFRLVERLSPQLDQRAADVVTFIADLGDDIVGVACIPFPVHSGCAYSAVHHSAMLGATFAHELGHNLGLSHDWYADGHVWAPSARGYVSLEGRFQTIMAYQDHCGDVLGNPPCSEMPFYSDPNRVYSGFPSGVPIGTSTQCTWHNPDNPPCDADATSALRESVPIVAGYRRHDNRLSSGSSLSPGQFLRANGAGAACSVKYQGDGNLVASFADGTAYWSTRTAGSSAGSVVMQDGGNLVVFDSLGAAVWASGTHGNAGASFAIQRDCNLVVRAASGEALWASGAPASRTPPAPMTSIQLFAAEPRIVEPGGSSRITLLGYGTEVSIWLTHPNGERVLWDRPPGALDRYSRDFVHQPEWGTGAFMLEAVVAGAEGALPATATTFITVTSSPGTSSPGTVPWIHKFTADPTTIKSGGWIAMLLEARGTEVSIWLTYPNGERHRWAPPGPLDWHGWGLQHQHEWGLGTFTLEAVVTGAEGTIPATATAAFTVTR